MNESDDVISLNLPTDTILQLALGAHEQDITLNSFMNQILERAVIDFVNDLEEEYKQSPWDRPDREHVIDRDQWKNRTHEV